MSKKIQTTISDKNNEQILELISSRDITDHSGNYLTSVSAVCSFMIDLGLRVYMASKEKKKDEFDLNGYRYEMFKRVLHSTQLSKSIILILNQLPEFEDRNLLDEFFNKNKNTSDWISNELRRFFNDKENDN